MWNVYWKGQLARERWCTARRLQFTKKIPRETRGRPIIKEIVNSSLRKRMPKSTPKRGVRKVKAASLLTA
jgi:hypothetical protein